MLLCYGEDAFTLRVISAGLPAFLAQFGDQSALPKCRALFRPSFGRRATTFGADKCAWQAAFGEFDAIVGTPKAIYLIEAKWSRSGEVRDGGTTVRLAPAQVRRHRIMRAYIERWRDLKPASWDEFAGDNALRQLLAEYCARVPGPKSALARNLRRYLHILGQFSGPIRDVVLFLRTAPSSPPSEIEPADFQLVTADCRIIESEGFLPLKLEDSGINVEMYLSPFSGAQPLAPPNYVLQQRGAN